MVSTEEKRKEGEERGVEGRGREDRGGAEREEKGGERRHSFCLILVRQESHER